MTAGSAAEAGGFDRDDVVRLLAGGEAAGVHGEAEAGTELLQWHLDAAKAEIVRLRERLRVRCRDLARAEAERDASRRRVSIDDLVTGFFMTDVRDNGAYHVKIAADWREHDSEWTYRFRWDGEPDECGVHGSGWGTADGWADALSTVLNETAGDDT